MESEVHYYSFSDIVLLYLLDTLSYGMDHHKEDLLNALYKTTSSRTLKLYKNCILQYVSWFKNKNSINSSITDHIGEDDLDLKDDLLFYKLPLNEHYIHFFILDNMFNSTNSNIDSMGKYINIMEDIVNCLLFADKLRDIYSDNQMDTKSVAIDKNYFINLLNLHRKFNNWDPAPLYKISINIWNNNSFKNLNSTNNSTNGDSISNSVFKTSLDKFKFLLDFHLTNFGKLSFDERSNLKLTSFKVINNIIYCDTNNNKRDSKNENLTSVHKPMAFLPQDCPFLCPYTSMAVYFILRFYGIKGVYRGDGFPDLYDTENFTNTILITGRKYNEYLTDACLRNYYSNIFKYCNFSYRKRNYFDWNNDSFPVWRDETLFAKIKENLTNELDILPIDYINILNWQRPINKKLDQLNHNFDIASIDNNINNNLGYKIKPPSLLVEKLFPDIELYKKNWNALSVEAQDFITVMERLRYQLIINLPIIYKIFPNHDIFKIEMFRDSDWQLFLNDFPILDNGKLPFNTLPGLKNEMTLEDFKNDLREPPNDLGTIIDNISVINSNRNSEDIDIARNTNEFGNANNNDDSAQTFNRSEGSCDSDLNIEDTNRIRHDNLNLQSLKVEMLEELKRQNYQFIQYQTLSNLKSFSELMNRIFINLSITNTSKIEIERQLNDFNNVLQEKINNTTTREARDFILKNEILKNKTSGKARSISFDDDTKISDDDENISYENGDLQEESDEEDDLKNLIDQLVTSRVNTLVSKQITALEDKLDKVLSTEIDQRVKEAIDEHLGNTIQNVIEKRPLYDEALDSDESFSHVSNNNNKRRNLGRHDENDGNSDFEMEQYKSVDNAKEESVNYFTERIRKKTRLVSSPYESTTPSLQFETPKNKTFLQDTSEIDDN